jgi:hypothetical protein
MALEGGQPIIDVSFGISPSISLQARCRIVRPREAGVDVLLVFCRQRHLWRPDAF